MARTNEDAQVVIGCIVLAVLLLVVAGLLGVVVGVWRFVL